MTMNELNIIINFLDKQVVGTPLILLANIAKMKPIDTADYLFFLEKQAFVKFDYQSGLSYITERGKRFMRNPQ